MKKPGTKNITKTQRTQLEGFLNAGLAIKEIAKLLGLGLSTIYREIKRGLCKQRYTVSDVYGFSEYKYSLKYCSDVAQRRYEYMQTSKGRPLKLGNDYDFVHYVEKRILIDRLSPCAVCGEIKRNNLFRTVISKTTMYRYVSNGIFMNIRMSDLPIGQKKRHYRSHVIKRAPKGVSIEKRPLSVSDRNTFGHWEMDCVVGETKKTLLTLVERLTRKAIIMLMPNRKTESVVHCLNVLERKYGSNFRKIFKTITVDNGSEFSDVAGLQKSIYRGKRLSMFYCHPYSSYERGTNERINREIRRWLPKGSNFSKESSLSLQLIENWINDYPREIFEYASSAERFNQQLAAI